MKEEKMAIKNPAGKEDEPLLENGKKKIKEEKPLTKIVVRRLPPSMTEEQFKDQVSPLPDIDYFYFVQADMSLMPNAFCRAYMNFVNQADLFVFTEKFDGYVFVDSKGGEYPAVVEFAPFQRIPKNRPNRKKDPKMGTIESTPAYIAFKEKLEAESLENKTTANTSKQHFFETSLVPEKKESVNTPLLDYVKQKRAERQKAREEKREEKRKRDLDRKKAKEEQRRIKKEEESSVVKVSSTLSVNLNPNTPVQTIPSNLVVHSSTKDDKVEGKETNLNKKQTPPLLQNTVIPEVKVTTKVREMVNFFNKSINESSCKKPGMNDSVHTPVKSYVEHKAIESEILQHANGIKDKSLNKQKYILNNTCKKLSFSKYSHINESNNIATFYNPTPIKTVVTTPRSKLRTQGVSEIIFKPVRINSLHCESSNQPNKINVEKDKISSSDTNFPSDIFRKNLQKVVDDVLGNANVKSPKENEINKPKTFIKRASDGSGEQYTRLGYNSPGFYLPPRAFGCGMGEAQRVTNKPWSDNTCDGLLPRPVLSAPSSKRNFSVFCRKPLPPFSKKPIFVSKSDGDIDKTPLKRKMERGFVEFNSRFLRRPYVAPKKFFVLQDSN